MRDPNAPDPQREKKIRVGLFMFTPMLGGAEQHFKDLIWHLDRNRFDVTVFFEPWKEFIDFLDLSHAPPHHACPVKIIEVGGHYGAKELTSDNAPKHLHWYEKIFLRVVALQKRLPFTVLKIPGRLFRAALQYWLAIVNNIHLTRAFREHPIDVLHVINGGYPGAQSAQLAGRAARRTGTQHCIMSTCNTTVPYFFPKTLDQFLDRCVKRSFDFLLIPADFIGEQLIARRGFALTQFKKIPYGVNEPQQYGATIPPLSTHEQSMEVTITMVASFLPHKGQRTFLDALSIVRETFPEIRAICIGDGPTLGEMQEHAHRNSLSPIVTFTGYRPLAETLTHMAESDIFVLSSEMEGMPYVILHAMSLGKPVIATPVGAIPEVILPNETGIIVPVRDHGALAEALLALLHDPERRRAMGAAGRKRYIEEYTVRVMVERHTNLYWDIAHAHKL